VRSAYGPHPRQFGELTTPGRAQGAPSPVAVLVHGGGWLEDHTLGLMEPLAADLAARGWAAWNVEFRGVGGAGGWPETFEDVAAAVDHLADLPVPLDLARVCLVGHSAGGTLALWAARETRRVGVAAVAAQAPVSDLAARAGDDPEGLVRRLLAAGPQDAPERYEAASPAARLPLGIPQLVVHGEADERVPADMSRGYVQAARARGDRATLVLRSGDDHLAHLDPYGAAWAAVLHWLEPWGP
jgi:dipeptidyl aminopeptidase/acylaminoacyl peptidase